MKNIGGEIELRDNDLFTYVTDSGRSSLRLVLKTNLRKKKFLIPDFICKSVLHVFNEAEVKYEFYKVKGDLTADSKSLFRKKFDVFYIIDYFGKKDTIINRVPKDKWIIEDGVFLPELKKPKGRKKWIGFNSLRKCTPLADGSIICSTMKLPEKYIEKGEAPFVNFKTAAKHCKHEYLSKGKYSEKYYLSLFAKGEASLDRQKRIFFISNKSLANAFSFYKHMDGERKIRDKNYQILDKVLRRFKISINVDFHTFYVIAVKDRDRLRNYLFKHKIYLPVHWPNIYKLSNKLYEQIISIPLDSRDKENDMARVAQLIKKFCERKDKKR